MKQVDDTRGNESPAMNNSFAIFLATLLLASCAVGPNYRAPPVAAGCRAKRPVQPNSSRNPPRRCGGRSLETPNSMSLVRRALAANLDLRSAYDRVRAARAVFVERKFDYAPHVQLRGRVLALR